MAPEAPGPPPVRVLWAATPGEIPPEPPEPPLAPPDDPPSPF
ncbi:hypothetical protein [Phaeacidiphilus oryzae]|nr:hypothetical protein [Phaeacidiphilus oryzae]